jgi:hypothetical protein
LGSHFPTVVSQSGNITLYLTDVSGGGEKDGYEHAVIRKGKGESLWLGDEKIGYLEGEEFKMVEVGKG